VRQCAPANDGPHLNVRPYSTPGCWHAALVQLGSNGGVALGAGRLNFTNDWQDVRCKQLYRASLESRDRQTTLSRKFANCLARHRRDKSWQLTRGAAFLRT